MSDAAAYAKRQEEWRMALGFIQTGDGKKKRPLPGRTYSVALAIQTFENRDTGLAWPSRETIGRKAGMFGSPATVERETSKHLKTLTRVGVLKESGHDRSGAVRYRFTIPNEIAVRMALGNSPQGSALNPVEESTPLGNSPQGVELSTGVPLWKYPQGRGVEQSTGVPWGTVHRGTSEGTSEGTFDYEPPIDTPPLVDTREEEQPMSGFDRLMTEWEAKSAQATASSSEGHLSTEEINECWDQLDSSSPSEDREEVAALPAGDKDETSSGESFPVHADADSLEESTPQPVAAPNFGTPEEPTEEFFQLAATIGITRSAWNLFDESRHRVFWESAMRQWEQDQRNIAPSSV